ncbi:hypothetical protein HRM2_04730 [Desulforapulum autotrophicum HRM2]|uniref:PilZ domain-containing protein n=1 Tax=Desulforapulum autotrophicum (strain ATCC 43914 / DSM 3382 / VKM B-1955 / HRM2) TaxID=177437 RepID=C0QHM9_DESAH|nr:hypothetical protein HRM2_04730 [Desulforapulum autotrophicum HRM2]
MFDLPFTTMGGKEKALFFCIDTALFFIYQIKGIFVCPCHKPEPKELVLLSQILMTEHANRGNQTDKRYAPRQYLDKFHSVELFITDLPYSYQFKLRDRSEAGLCVLVQENSEIMNHLHLGDVLEIKYCPRDKSDPAVKLSTRIRHITKTPKGNSNRHYYVGLMIVDSPPC